MRKFVLIFLAVLFSGISASAQNRTVSGTVTDSDGNPLAGIAVILRNSSISAVTDANGIYTISNVPANGVIEISYPAHVTQAIATQGRSRIDVIMEPDPTVMDDLIITGYSVIRRSAFTGSATVVGESVVNSKTDMNFLKTLDGSVTGLKVSSRSGIPGGYTEVFVRGAGSINSGKEPLYVVDGVPIFSDKQSMDASQVDGNMMYFSPLANINPNDIESVTVLKDATATAIYGSRAGNGVVVISTKKGSGGRLNVDFDMKFGINQIAPYTDKYKLIGSEKYFDIWARAADAAGVYSYEDVMSWWDGKTDTDWMKEITRNGAVQDINLSVSGSTQNVSYFSSLGYMKSEGFVIGTGTERYTGRLNLEGRSKIFTYGMSTSLTQSIFEGIPNNSSYVNPVVAVYDATPDYPVYNEDGTFFMDDGLAAGYNPVAIQDPNIGDIRRQTHTVVVANPYLAANLGYGLIAKTSLGFTLYDFKEYDYWSSQVNPQGMDYNGLGQQYNTQRTYITWTNTLNWLYTFNNVHNVSLMLGQEMQRKTLFEEYYAGTNFTPGFRQLNAASKESGPGNNESGYQRMASYFINAEYDYDHKYYVSGSFRRDGASSFGQDTFWGNFWSVGAKWRVSQEDFLKDNKIVSNLAVRASYGTVGNSDIGWYAGRGFYDVGYNYDQRPGLRRNSMSNTNLSWEQSNKLNVGFDLGFIDRFNFIVDIYSEKTSDMLFQLPLSYVSGIPSVYSNIGSMKNTGVELGFSSVLMQKKDLLWTFYANVTFNKNEVLKLSTDEPIKATVTIIEEGKPLYQFYMPEYAGVDPDNGNPLWWSNRDASGNTVADYKTNNYNLADKRHVGSADPKVFGGFGTAVNFRGIDFSMNFSFQTGGKVYNSGHSYDLQAGHYSFGPVSNYVYDNAWTENNRDTDVPKFVYRSRRGEYNHSSRFLYSSNFLRLKSITLGYTLPVRWTQKAFMQKVRVYVTSDNLFTVKQRDFIGFDPESAPNGLQQWAYPTARTFSAGLTLGF